MWNFNNSFQQSLYYFFQFFRINGYSNPHSMKRIDDLSITNVENFVQNDMMALLEAEYGNRKSKFSDADKCYFFGPFTSDPKHFRILPGDRALIQEYVDHTVRILDKTGIKYFGVSKKYEILNKKDIFVLDIGPYFVEAREDEPNFRKRTHDGSSKDNLINRLTEAKTLLVKEYPVLSDFKISADLINIVNDGNKVGASMECSVCKTHLKKHKELRIQYDLSSVNAAAYWNISNVKKHLRLHGKKIANSDESNVVSEAAVVNKNAKPNSVTDANENATKNVEMIDDKLPSLKIFEEPNNMALMERYEHMIYQQISNQNLEMAKSNMINGAKSDTVSFNLSNQVVNVQTVKISPDGNCLFGSLVHQLFGYKVNSAEYDDEVKNLRTNVVKFIKENLEDFKFTLKWRISPTGLLENINEACESFLSSKLSVSGEWAGAETILAVSKMLRVNVIVFDEDDKHYLNSDFNPEYIRTLLLAYRSSFGGKKTQVKNSVKVRRAQRDHYDSVTEVPQGILMDLVKITAIIESNKVLTAGKSQSVGD